MQKIIVTIHTEQDFNAASKARIDIEALARELGYEPFSFIGERTSDGSLSSALNLVHTSIQNWARLLSSAEKGSIVLIQYPNYPMKSAYLARWILPWAKRKKQLRFIALIHDLNSLRGTFGRAAVFSDQHMLKQFDAVICHNERMRQVLLTWGFPAKKIHILGLFDYMTTVQPQTHHLSDGVSIAGNLSPDKCGYVLKLAKSIHCPLHLYGRGLDAQLPDRVQFHGAFPPEKLPGALCGAFGLVWDGPSTQTCEGQMGNYLRYNNPHKVSLYLSSGMPVIVWRESALADMITSSGLGIAVNSLDEIEPRLAQIDDAEYASLCRHVKDWEKKIQTGVFTKTAIQCAERTVEKN